MKEKDKQELRALINHWLNQAIRIESETWKDPEIRKGQIAVCLRQAATYEAMLNH